MTTVHHVHGLADDETTPDWPPLQAAEIAALLDRFPKLRGPVVVNWLSPRPFSAAARVQTRAGEVFVKRHHHEVRSRARLLVEHTFAAHLRHHGIPSPRIVADADGRTAIEQGTWTYEVHAIADGIDTYRDTPSWTPLTDLGHARTAGHMLARLHHASTGFTADAQSTSILVARDTLLRADHFITAIETQCERHPALGAYLQRHDWRSDLAALAHRQRSVQLRLADAPRLWTHNDWHVSNLFWTGPQSDAGITAVVDFGLASPTFALYDLATAIERNAIAWLHLERGAQAAFPDTARALIAGYTEVQALTLGQRELLAALLPIVHIDFALSEIEYFSAITHSTANADLAYHRFLLGHAAWFDTAPGYALLQALRHG